MRESDQAFFNTDPVLTVDQAMVEELKRRALVAPHRRYRLCLHESADERVQEMIIVHCKDNYSRPHYHPGTATSCMILDGELTVYLFDGAGKITQTIELGPPSSGRPFTLRLGPDIWHMPVCRSDQLVFYETMEGPFRRDDINVWAPWSPHEDDAEGIREYLAELSRPA